MLLTSASCEKRDKNADLKNNLSFIFLGHTYDWHSDGKKVDPRLEKIDYSQFDGVWLGGDICSETTRDRSTLDYLDALFDLDASSTLWSIGNHDARNGNIDWLEEVTARSLYYSQHQRGVTYLVLNTVAAGLDVFEEDRCEILERQDELVRSVMDTIEESSHLVFITHYIHWNGIENDMPRVRFANAPKGYLSLLCDEKTNMRNIWYDQMKEVQARGVEVVMISGDGGQYNKGYEYTTDEGIRFLCSGINNSLDTLECPGCDIGFNWNPDSILILDLDVKARSLNHRFENLNEFIGP